MAGHAQLKFVMSECSKTQILDAVQIVCFVFFRFRIPYQTTVTVLLFCKAVISFIFYSRVLKYEGHPINSVIFFIIHARLQFVYQECNRWVANLVSHTTNNPTCKCLYAGRLPLPSNERTLVKRHKPGVKKLLPW